MFISKDKIVVSTVLYVQCQTGPECVQLLTITRSTQYRQGSVLEPGQPVIILGFSFDLTPKGVVFSSSLSFFILL